MRPSVPPTSGDGRGPDGGAGASAADARSAAASGPGAFANVRLDARRSLHKPRRGGLTMISEWGLGRSALADFIDRAGRFVDVAKIPTGTARLYPRAALVDKLAAYRAASVRTLLGGQFQEYVLHTEGVAGMDAHLDEARALGFDLVEVSDNRVAVPAPVRSRIVAAARSRGLGAWLEVGSKAAASAPDALVDAIRAGLDAGAEQVVLEGRELIDDGVVNERLVDAVAASGLAARVVFEVPTPRVGSTTVDIYRVKKALVRAFGPDVNLGNIAPELVFETETTRLGLGSSGPLDLMG